MAINSDVGICNLALSILGNSGEVTSIDLPVTKAESVFALWYDVTRQEALKTLMPNFALSRRLVAALDETVPFGYENVFEYPQDCLKVLGLGNLEDKSNYLYSVENNRIYTEDEWADGLQLRFIRDVTVVADFSPEFVVTLAKMLANNVCMDITLDLKKKTLTESILANSALTTSGLNAQENRPVRISNSKFTASRYYDVSRNPSKK